jgi:hypothetical protein
VNAISELDKCEDFYRDVFLTYGLIYNTETIRQKRTFVAATTRYFILDRLPEDCLSFNDNKYEPNSKNGLKKLLSSTIDIYYTIHDSSTSNEDFKKKYAEHFNEEVKDFSKEISENRDDSLSDFAKAIEKLYYSEDEKQ